MKVLLETLASGVFGLCAVGLFWMAVEMDNDELQAGKSPHSGFTPDCPQALTVSQNRPALRGPEKSNNH